MRSGNHDVIDLGDVSEVSPATCTATCLFIELHQYSTKGQTAKPLQKQATHREYQYRQNEERFMAVQICQRKLTNSEAIHELNYSSKY